jgi:hypothetical protein
MTFVLCQVCVCVCVCVCDMVESAFGVVVM